MLLDKKKWRVDEWDTVLEQSGRSDDIIRWTEGSVVQWWPVYRLVSESCPDIIQEKNNIGAGCWSRGKESLLSPHHYQLTEHCNLTASLVCLMSVWPSDEGCLGRMGGCQGLVLVPFFRLFWMTWKCRDSLGGCWTCLTARSPKLSQPPHVWDWGLENEGLGGGFRCSSSFPTGLGEFTLNWQ